MSEVLHANIFFFITSVVVLLIGFLAAWALYYIVIILKNVRDITDRIDRSSEELAQDLRELRHTIREKGMTISYFFTLFQGLIKKMVGAGTSVTKAATKRTVKRSPAAASASSVAHTTSAQKTDSDDVGGDDSAADAAQVES